MSSKQDKRKKKKKYFQSNKKPKTGVLETGLKGILITCNNFEYQCVRESYNILSEFADNLYGPENMTSEKESSDMDIEAELAEEIEAIKFKKRRFQQVCTKAKGVLFINTTVTDPTKLVSSIFEEALKTGKRKTRYILRMKPVVITCKPDHNDMRKHLDAYFEELLKDDNNKNLSYKTETTIRNNSSVTKDHTHWYVRESIEKYAPDWTVSLTQPQLVISVDVLRNVCCIGFLRNFFEYRKYNLPETAAVKEKEEQKEKCQSEPEATDSSILSEKKEIKNESVDTDSNGKKELSAEL